MLGIKVCRRDARAVRAAMRDLRALGLIDGQSREVRLEMYCALWHYLEPVTDAVAHSIAYLAGMVYLRERLHLAPTAEVSRPAPLHAPQPSASWWGMLTHHDEDDT